jgi:hypothetical protein
MNPMVPNVPWSKQTGTSMREKCEESELRFCTSHEDDRVERAMEKRAGPSGAADAAEDADE